MPEKLRTDDNLNESLQKSRTARARSWTADGMSRPRSSAMSVAGFRPHLILRRLLPFTSRYTSVSP
jgi:hypothetical protein